MVEVLQPQPDFHRLANGLRDVITQVELIPNIPPPGDIQELSDLIKQLSTKIDGIQATVDRIDQT
jgi:hypothetical protein